MVEDLVPAAQNQVVAGIQAGTLDDARGEEGLGIAGGVAQDVDSGQAYAELRQRLDGGV